jgi:hypothetical protein
MKRYSNSGGHKTFSGTWIGRTTRHFTQGERFDAFSVGRKNYGLSLLGMWVSIGDEGKRWEWNNARLNPCHGRRLKRNPRDFGEEESYRAADQGNEPEPSFKGIWNDEDTDDGFVYGKEFDGGEIYDARSDETVYWGWPAGSLYGREIDKDSFKFAPAKVKRNGMDFSDYTKRDCLAYIKANDRNGYELLDGGETVEELRDTCRAIYALGV